MKKVLALLLVLVILVASFAVGALGAVDLQKKPEGPPVELSRCYYMCIDSGSYMSMYYCCQCFGTVCCDLLYSAIAHCG